LPGAGLLDEPLALEPSQPGPEAIGVEGHSFPDGRKGAEGEKVGAVGFPKRVKGF